MNKKRIVMGVVVIGILLVGILYLSKDRSTFESSEAPKEKLDSVILNSQLRDIRTGSTFTIQQLNDKPILLESFAVWCPTCTRQQENIRQLHEIQGYTENEVISISLNTDNNENEEKIKNHLDIHKFNWYYAKSNDELTQTLVDKFGKVIASSPSAPIILICPKGGATLLKTGLKSVDYLKQSIDSCN